MTYPTLENDRRLVLAAQSGCRASFNELWNLYSQRVYRTILTITKNAEDAEDAMQEAFLRAFLALGRFEGRANFYTWLTRIAMNCALMILRKRRTHPEVSLDLQPEWSDEPASFEFKDLAPDPEQCYDQRQRSALLLRAIHRLPPNLRKAIKASVTEECSVKQTAELLNISECAAKSRLFRARKRLGISAIARRGSAVPAIASSRSVSLQQ